jgi:excisionase family DNA binding protein
VTPAGSPTRRSTSGARLDTVPDDPSGPIGSHSMETLTPAEVAEILGVSPNRVRQLLREGKLMAVPSSGNSRIPADFLHNGAVLKHLPGLLTLLRDGGFTDEEAFDWLFRSDESLPGTPVEALRSNRHSEVSRRAQALAY